MADVAAPKECHAPAPVAAGGLRCCGAPAAPPANPSAGWDGLSDWYTKWMSPGTATVAMSLFGHMGLLTPGSAPMRVLETHCGDARAATGLLPSTAVASYTVADFSDEMLKAAAANLGEHATVVNTEATKLPFESASFDRYTSNLGLCCTPDITAKLAEARRVLAPGGIAAMSLRIEGGEGDTAFKLIQETLRPFGIPPGPDREGVHLGKDLPALRTRVEAAGFKEPVAWRTFATLPIHNVQQFMEFATSQPPTRRFLLSLEATEQRKAAEDALAAAAVNALSKGAIQVAVAVVVAKC